MLFRKSNILAIALLLLLPAVVPATTEISHLYREAAGENIRQMFWHLTLGGEAVVRSGSGNNRFVNVCDHEGNTLSWQMEQDGRQVAATRERNVIVLRSSPEDGGKILETLKIDDAPWYQALSFSLAALAQGRQTGSPEFWTIRPDNLEAIKLQAEVAGQEQIHLDGREVEAVRVAVRPTGLLALFWSGNYWFRATDGTFLKYQGRNGPPGAPQTEITLIR